MVSKRKLQNNFTLIVLLFSNQQCSSQAHTCLVCKIMCLWAVHFVPLQAETQSISLYVPHLSSWRQKMRRHLQKYHISKFSKCCCLLLEARHISVLSRDYLNSWSGWCLRSLSISKVYDLFCYCRILHTVYIITPLLWDKDDILGCLQPKVREDLVKDVLIRKLSLSDKK